MDWAFITPLGGAGHDHGNPGRPAKSGQCLCRGRRRRRANSGLRRHLDLINGSGATGLPGFFAGRTIQLDPKNFTDPADDVLYVGGNYGVFKMTNPGGAALVWSRMGGAYNPTNLRGLPDVAVSQLILNTTTGILAAGTMAPACGKFRFVVCSAAKSTKI